MKHFSKHIWKSVGAYLVSAACINSALAQKEVIVDSLIHSNRAGIENTLQGSVAGLRVKSWSGTTGSQSTINLRGLSIDPTDQSTQPLLLINGVPVLMNPSQVSGINPLSYFAPGEIERVEILKTVEQLALYGIQAPNGAINLIMKEGKKGPLHVRASASAGVNFMNNFNYKKDAFYGFNTIGRREVYDHGGVLHEQQLLIDGGGEYGSYLFGLNNHQDKGVINNSSFERQSLFLNAKYNISPKLTAHFYNNLALGSRDGRYVGEESRQLTLPVVPNEDFYMDKKRNVGFLSSIGLKYQWTENLTINTLAGLTYEGSSRDMYVPSNILKGNIHSASHALKRQMININTHINYLKEVSENWKVDLKLGHELRTNDFRLTSVDGSRSLESGGSNYVKVVTGYNANQANALSDFELEKLIGFYGTGKFKFQDKLDLNVVLRTDGSSLYKDKWGFYPAVGFAYRLSDESKTPITFSGSIGKTGMLNRPAVYAGELVAKGDYFSGNELGISQLYSALPNAKSVDVAQIDAGVKIGLTPKIVLSLDYFNKTYSDFSYRRYLPNIEGINFQYENGGKINLSGFELTLDGNWVNTSDFSWSTNLNAAAYSNSVKELPANISSTSLSHLAALEKGDAITSIIANENGRGKVIGNSEPSLFGGVTNQFRFKNITAGFVVLFSAASDIATESISSRYTQESVGAQFPLKKEETPYYFLEGAGRNAIYQGIRTIENGSFVRLGRAELAYNLQSIQNSKLNLTDFKIFVRGQNLYTLTKYSGVNPEENIAGIRKRDLSLTGTPLPSSVVIGIKLLF